MTPPLEIGFQPDLYQLVNIPLSQHITRKAEYVDIVVSATQIRSNLVIDGSCSYPVMLVGSDCHSEFYELAARHQAKKRGKGTFFQYAVSPDGGD